MATTSPEIKPAVKNTLAVYLIFAVSGASALIYQVIWTRWLGLVFGNTTLSVSIVLGSFMLGLALGSWIAGRLMHSIENPMRLYAFMEMGIGIFALLFPLFTRFTDFVFPLLVHSVSLNWYSLLVRAVLSIAVLLVPTTFMGTTLPLLTDFFHRSPVHTRNWRVGVLYAVNTLGAALGIIAGSFILIEAIGVLDTTRAAAALNLSWRLPDMRFPAGLLSKKMTPRQRAAGALPARANLPLRRLRQAGSWRWLPRCFGPGRWRR